MAERAEANTQRATAVANGTEAERARGTAVANLAHADALRLAAEAKRVMDTGGPSELAGLLSLRSVQADYSRQGDAALEAAARLDYPSRHLDGHTHGIGISLFSPTANTCLHRASWRCWSGT